MFFNSVFTIFIDFCSIMMMKNYKILILLILLSDRDKEEKTIKSILDRRVKDRNEHES